MLHARANDRVYEKARDREMGRDAANAHTNDGENKVMTSCSQARSKIERKAEKQPKVDGEGGKQRKESEGDEHCTPPHLSTTMPSAVRVCGGSGVESRHTTQAANDILHMRARCDPRHSACTLRAPFIAFLGFALPPLSRLRSHSDETHPPRVESSAACPVLFTHTYVHTCQMYMGQGNGMLRVVSLRTHTHTRHLRLPSSTRPLLNSSFV